MHKKVYFLLRRIGGNCITYMSPVCVYGFFWFYRQQSVAALISGVKVATIPQPLERSDAFYR